jgi:tryptophan synthase alpha chain
LFENVAWLKQQTDVPVAIGFGINRPEHVRALAPVADGLIVGSAIVRRIAEAGQKARAAVLTDVGEYLSTLIAALEPAAKT